MDSHQLTRAGRPGTRGTRRRCSKVTKVSLYRWLLPLLPHYPMNSYAVPLREGCLAYLENKREAECDTNRTVQYQPSLNATATEEHLSELEEFYVVKVAPM